MSRRTWTPSDPEPDDHPDVMDECGEVWVYEDEVQPCPCGAHACAFRSHGYWSPTIGTFDLCDWAEIWQTASHRPGAPTRYATTLHELTSAERLELCGEMFS